MGSACFTGHRNIKEPVANLHRRLKRCILSAVNNYDVTEFYVGGAVGFDMLAAREVLKIMNTLEIHLHIILPCSYNEYNSKWSDKDKKMLLELTNKATSVKVLSEHYYDGCMKIRNQHLVDAADALCICYYNPNNKRSGTGQTVRMAERKGLIIKNLYK